MWCGVALRKCVPAGLQRALSPQELPQLAGWLAVMAAAGEGMVSCHSLMTPHTRRS